MIIETSEVGSASEQRRVGFKRSSSTNVLRSTDRLLVEDFLTEILFFFSFTFMARESRVVISEINCI